MQFATHPNFRICWNCNPQDLEDGGIRTNFEIVKDRIGLVHMRDLYEDYPYSELFQMLRGIDYQGFCLAEIPETSDPIRVMKYFRTLFEAQQAC
jgi:hypothetical protein